MFFHSLLYEKKWNSLFVKAPSSLNTDFYLFLQYLLLKGTYAACGFQVKLQRKQMQFLVQVTLGPHSTLPIWEGFL